MNGQQKPLRYLSTKLHGSRRQLEDSNDSSGTTESRSMTAGIASTCSAAGRSRRALRDGEAPIPSAHDRCAHQRDSRGQISHDERGFHAEHAIAERLEPGIPPSISLLA